MIEINTLEQKINGMDKKIDTVLLKMDVLVTDVAELKVKVTRVENDIENLAIATKHGFDQVFGKFNEVDEQFEQMLTKSEFNEKMEEFTSHGQRIDSVEDDVRILKRSFR